MTEKHSVPQTWKHGLSSQVEITPNSEPETTGPGVMGLAIG